MSGCTLCPRRCGGDRTACSGFCGGGAAAAVGRADLHFWEEPPISGTRGSGTVFFTGCGLRCVYCQNHAISRDGGTGRKYTPKELSGLFAGLVEKGAHNINLVTAGHYVPQVAEALKLQRLPVPVVYNCGGYESAEALKLLEGLVQIYLPDFKYAENSLGKAFSGVEDYKETALAAIREMRRQQPADVFDEAGIMQRGLLIRHLILPLHTRNSIAALELLCKEFPETLVSLMAQYTPVISPESEAGRQYPELLRGITKREFEKVQETLFRLEIPGFVQNRKAMGVEFIPSFHLK